MDVETRLTWFLRHRRFLRVTDQLGGLKCPFAARVDAIMYTVSNDLKMARSRPNCVIVSSQDVGDPFQKPTLSRRLK